VAVEPESAGDDFETMSHAVNDRVVGDFSGMSSTSVKVPSSLHSPTHTAVLMLHKYTVKARPAELITAN